MNTDDNSALGRIYDGAKELFRRGEHGRALDRFQSIYEVDCTFRDVAEIVHDYHDTAKDQWVPKYKARFGQEH